MALTTKIVLTGSLFLITIASGIYLSKTGRPLNAAVFNIHKLVALAVVILSVLVIYNLQKNAKITFMMVSFIILSAVFVISTFASGAFLSFDKPAEIIVLKIHNISMVLTLVFTVLTVFFLNKK